MAILFTKRGTPPSIPMFLFTIDMSKSSLGTVEFECKEGMTWTEWVNSKYASGYDFYIDSTNGNYVYQKTGTGWVVALNDGSYDEVHPTDTIENGGSYTLIM